MCFELVAVVVFDVVWFCLDSVSRPSGGGYKLVAEDESLSSDADADEEDELFRLPPKAKNSKHVTFVPAPNVTQQRFVPVSDSEQ